MKKILIFIIAIAITGLYSCEKKDLLDAKPNTDLNEATTFSDSARTMDFLFGTYAEISFAFGYRRYTYASNISHGTAEGCDEGTSRLAGGTQPFVYLFNGTMSPAFGAPYEYMWTKPWTNIRRANVFIANVDKSPLSESNKKMAKAEARFLRAWYYSILLRNFAGIPLIGDKVFAADDKIDMPRNSYEECVNYIVNETDAAAAALPTEHTSQNYGRITKGACLGLKSRVLLYAASPLFNGGSTATSEEVKKLTAYPTADPQRWVKAAEAAKAVIDMNLYSLYEDNTTAPGYGFSRVFLMRKNPEYILPGMQGSNKTMEQFALPPSRGTGTVQVAPSHNLAEAFGMRNGKAITDPTSGYNANDPFVNRDPRFGYTFIYNNSLWFSTTTNTKIAVNITYTKNANGTYTGLGDATLVWIAGYFWRKMMDENTASNGGPNTERCLPLIRYAEILLNYAEAINETGNIGIAYDQLKLIRKRAGILPGADGLYGLQAGMNKDEMRAAIVNERMVELAYEDHRYFDVRRWKTAPANQNFIMKAIRPVKTGNVITYDIQNVANNPVHVFKDAYYLFPIMQSELGKNANLVQNPGY